MPTPMLFLVHGMGKHPDGWSIPIVQQLRRLAGHYEAFKSDPTLFDRLKIVEIAYDDILNKVMAPFGKSADALRTYILTNHIPIPGTGLDSLLSWLGGASTDEQNFFWESAVDVLLWRFIGEAKQGVLASVIKQLIAPLAEAADRREAVRPSILAHSLGTSVIHDALEWLASTDDAEYAPFTQQMFSNLFMVANVSRVLGDPNTVYGPPVCPASAGGGRCDWYLNFRHRFDPFPAVAPFTPPHSWAPRFVAVEDLEHFHQVNVHALEHYLEHPAVHIPILRTVFGDVVTVPEEAKALHDFPAIAPTPGLQQQIDGFKSRLNQLQPFLKDLSDPVKFVAMAGQYGGWI